MDWTLLTEDETYRFGRHISRMQASIVLITLSIPVLFAAWCYYVSGVPQDDLVFCALMNLFVILPFSAYSIGVWGTKRENKTKRTVDVWRVRRLWGQRRLVVETRHENSRTWTLSVYHFTDSRLYRKLKRLGPQDIVRLTMLPHAGIVLDAEVVSHASCKEQDSGG